MSYRRLESALHMLRSGAAALALGLLMADASALSARPLEAVAISQPGPGDVTVTVRAPDTPPRADAFTLQLPNANAAPTNVPAQSVDAADALSPDLATAVLLCLDRSGSMFSAVPAIKTALKDVLAQPRPDLRIALMSFGSDTPGPTPFYAESPPILAAVDALRAETGHDGKTRLYDALNIGMSTLANVPQQGKRLIVITDGKDEGSRTSFDVLSAVMQGRGQPMHAIAFGQAAQKSSAGLATLASKSGGAFVLATSPSSLADALRDDLGTAPAPVYAVKFHYEAASDAPPLQSAQLVYAADAGAPPVLIPIRAALAAPAASSTQVAVTSSSEVASAAEAEPVATTASKPGSFITIGTVKIDVKIGFSVLVGLAMVLSAIAYALHRRSTRVEPTTTVAPTHDPKPQRQATRVGALFAPPSPGHPTALLVNEGPRRAPVSYAIEKPNVRIGADDTNDLVVHDDFVSRKHANIRFESGTLYLTDLGSSNGTFLNDARVSRVMTLNPGDKIRFGHTTWEVTRPDDPRSQPHNSGERYERPVP
ncbi:von Willebrand factor type A domain/FHA domain (plasmid) [Paraburkholderia caribensis MBA4]|uniref:von Willebrand factor type A domain/FHA domain n=1 Tax=Paraburkholderia caribensis MBA4 TaxID=1323664 RepID=A0A0P0RPQ7_9BURK|nr:FHA domain-containing protein [Paraburkholderia caribensis]ALL70953.1 von Willebrand factor type A domain/FHA domain [Paraburkholderia caribensis MBA4]